jgi:signal transduction histidine kinase
MEAVSSISGEKRRITVRTTLGDSMALISVSDCGLGVPADKLKEIFEPFFTTKQHGMGMGLSIARTIVEAHEGKIWAESRPDGGAFFCVVIPLRNSEGRS